MISITRYYTTDNNAFSTELAQRYAAFSLLPFHLRYPFSQIRSELLLLCFLMEHFAAISAKVDKTARA